MRKGFICAVYSEYIFFSKVNKSKHISHQDSYCIEKEQGPIVWQHSLGALRCIQCITMDTIVYFIFPSFLIHNLLPDF